MHRHMQWAQHIPYIFKIWHIYEKNAPHCKPGKYKSKLQWVIAPFRPAITKKKKKISECSEKANLRDLVGMHSSITVMESGLKIATHETPKTNNN